MRPVLVRLAGFTGLPLLSLITPFLLLPLMARIEGESGWAALGAGQAIGAFGATVVLWGWNIKGPVIIARSPSAQDRADVYRESLRSRFLLLLVVAPAVLVLASTIAPSGSQLNAAGMAVTTLLTALSPAWFCIGLGRPRLLALFDTLPRFAATAVSLPVLYFSQTIWLYPMILIAFVAAGLFFFQRVVVPESSGTFTRWKGTARQLATQARTAGISISGSLYAATPVPIAVLTVGAAGSAGFNSADTFYRFGLFTVIALGNTFQSWVLEPEADPAQRQKLAVWAHMALGALGFALFAALGPWASAIAFKEELRADFWTCVFYGLSFFFISASTPFIRNMLIPFGGQTIVLIWTAISAVVGVAMMFYFGSIGWAGGIALGLALSEGVLFFGLILPGLQKFRQAMQEEKLGMH